MGEAKQRKDAGLPPKTQNQVVFATNPERTLLTLGVPEAAWEYMKDGKTHNFDLRRVGFPVGIMMFGGPSRAAILDQLSPVMQGKRVLYDMKTDYSIPEAPKGERELDRMATRAREWLKTHYVQISEGEAEKLILAILNPESPDGQK